MLLLNRKQILTIFWHHFGTQYMGIIGTLLDLVDMQLIWFKFMYLYIFLFVWFKHSFFSSATLQ